MKSSNLLLALPTFPILAATAFHTTLLGNRRSSPASPASRLGFKDAKEGDVDEDDPTARDGRRRKTIFGGALALPFFLEGGGPRPADATASAVEVEREVQTVVDFPTCR